MNDGRIIENTEIKKIEKELKPQESIYNNISIFNKYRLGFRNTFNILSKFLLLFAVFLFMSSAILAEYASFQISEEGTSYEGNNMFFNDSSENRIIINKKDRTAFTNENYEKIKKLSNVDYIVKDDILLDFNINLSRNNILFWGYINNIENFKNEIDLGRMPENENEIILKIDKDNFYIKQSLDEILNKTYSILNLKSEGRTIDLTIVGIKYSEDNNNNNIYFYASKSIMNSLRSDIHRYYSNVKIFLNNKYEQYTVEANENVEAGKVIVDDELKYQFENYKIIGQPLDIYVNNIYYNDELNLTISNTYTKSNFKKITGLNEYSDNRYKILVNKDDYDSLFNKSSYQSSVFVKDTKIIEETLTELNSMNIETTKVTDFTVSQVESYKGIIKIIKVVVTIALIIVLSFISYIIIKIILKSRNTYYTTLRILGATYKNVRRILDIELFTNATISYGILMLFLYCIKSNLLNFEYIAKLTNYLGIKEYVFMYVILITISMLISRKYARQLFKNTAINTYNEEV